LEVHPDKTRRIEFGRFAEQNREQRGEGKPETFDFLGFTHISGKDKNGRLSVRRKTMRKRMRGKLRQIKQQLCERMHDPVPQTGQVAPVGVTRPFQLPCGARQRGQS
jgi:RNA-directed DNA polymerase